MHFPSIQRTAAANDLGKICHTPSTSKNMSEIVKTINDRLVYTYELYILITLFIAMNVIDRRMYVHVCKKYIFNFIAFMLILGNLQMEIFCQLALSVFDR